MLYAMLCYHQEDVVCAWSKDEDDAVMEKLLAVQEPWARAGESWGRSLGCCRPPPLPPCARTPTRPWCWAGPFAETKEQLLGFYVLEAEDLEEALGFARDLAKANPGGSYEIRPIAMFMPGPAAADRAPALAEP